MIPSYDYYEEEEEQSDFEVTTEPSKTYNLNLENYIVVGTTDGLTAVKQAVYKVLNTELYADIIYEDDYGIQVGDLIGRDISYVETILEKRIEEALLEDDRIESVDDYVFTKEKGKLCVIFTVTTTEGDFNAEMEVDV